VLVPYDLHVPDHLQFHFRVEHLQVNQLDRFTESIFHDYKPLLVIVTTPNSEFNELFHFPPDKQFRHWDHKFEWTRQQFQDW